MSLIVGKQLKVVIYLVLLKYLFDLNKNSLYVITYSTVLC